MSGCRPPAWCGRLGRRNAACYGYARRVNAATDFLAAAELGTRVVVRTRIPGGLTDALGYLRAIDAQSCTVETRSGVVTLLLADVHLAKAVPPPPAPRR